MKVWMLVVLVVGMGGVSVWAQDESESMGGGINTPSGLTDLRASQQRGPFSEFPWDVQSLLEKNLDVLRKTPEPVRNHLLNKAMDWDVLFGVEQQRVIQFLKRAKPLSEDEIAGVFQNVSVQEYAIEWAIDQWLWEKEKHIPALIVVVVKNETDEQRQEALLPDGLKQESVLISNLLFGEHWLDELLVGKGQESFTVLSQIRQHANPKNPYSAIAVVDSLPSAMACKQKGDAKKYAPLVVGTEDLMPSVKLSKDILLKESGRSEAYLDMVRSKWTPESLKMPKPYRQKALGDLVMRAINKPGMDVLDTSFRQHMALNLVWRAQPDAMLVMVSDTRIGELQNFMDMLVTSLNNRLRYADNSLLVVVDEGHQKVFLLGALARDIEAQHPMTFTDLSQSLVQHLEYNRAVQ